MQSWADATAFSRDAGRSIRPCGTTGKKTIKQEILIRKTVRDAEPDQWSEGLFAPGIVGHVNKSVGHVNESACPKWQITRPSGRDRPCHCRDRRFHASHPGPQHALLSLA